jgi:hypothetical protein
MRSIDRTYLALWLVWIASFVAIETWAVRRDMKGDTLSEFVWALLATHPLLWILFLAFLIWLGLHLLSGGRIA